MAKHIKKIMFIAALGAALGYAVHEPVTYLVHLGKSSLGLTHVPYLTLQEQDGQYYLRKNDERLPLTVNENGIFVGDSAYLTSQVLAQSLTHDQQQRLASRVLDDLLENVDANKDLLNELTRSYAASEPLEALDALGREHVLSYCKYVLAENTRGLLERSRDTMKHWFDEVFK